MEREGIYRTVRERLRERKDVRGLIQAFSLSRTTESGASRSAGVEEPGRGSDAWVALALDKKGISMNAEDLLGRIGDARSLEPLLRLKAGEEKA